MSIKPTKITRKIIKITKNTQKNNNMHNNNKNTSRVTQNNFKYNPKLKDITYVEPDVWNKMSWDDRFTIMDNRKKQSNNNNGNNKDNVTKPNFNNNQNNTRFVKFAECQEETDDCNT